MFYKPQLVEVLCVVSGNSTRKAAAAKEVYGNLMDGFSF